MTISTNDRMKRRLVSLAVLVYQHTVRDMTYRATLKVVHFSKSLICVIWRKVKYARQILSLLCGKDWNTI